MFQSQSQENTSQQPAATVNVTCSYQQETAGFIYENGTPISTICSSTTNIAYNANYGNVGTVCYSWSQATGGYEAGYPPPGVGSEYYCVAAPVVPYQERPGPEYWNPQYCNPSTATLADWYAQALPTKSVPTTTAYSGSNDNPSSYAPPPTSTPPSSSKHQYEQPPEISSSSGRKRKCEHEQSDYYARDSCPRSRERDDHHYPRSERRTRRDSDKSRSRSRSRGPKRRTTDGHDHDRSKNHEHSGSGYGHSRSLESIRSRNAENNRGSSRGDRSYDRRSDNDKIRNISAASSRHNHNSRHYNASSRDGKRYSPEPHSSSTSRYHSRNSHHHHSSHHHRRSSHHYDSTSSNRTGNHFTSRSEFTSHRHEGRRSSFKTELDSDLCHDDTTMDGEQSDDEFDENIERWVRSAPAELYYTRDQSEMKATERTNQLCKKFETNLLEKAKNLREEAEKLGAEKMQELIAKEIDEFGEEESSTSDSGESSGDEEKPSKPTRSNAANRELERRKLHPKRLHPELWHNDPGLMNDGPVCRCSAKARRFGIRHGFYPGEDEPFICDPDSNNPTKLHHYRITITPAKNFLVNSPTVINHDGHDYLFEGFSLFSHYELDLKLPPCKVIRFNIRYDVFVEKEPHPESFCVKELNLFETYLFREVLELVDLKRDWEQTDRCSQFHLMPRFVRQLPDNGREILAMNRVLLHTLKNDKELIKEEDLLKLLQVDQKEWQNFADKHKGMIVTKWGMKPCAIRVDQIDRDITFGKDSPSNDDEGIPFPLIVHFGIRPPQLSYAGNSKYQRAWRRYVKYRHLLSNMPKPSVEEKRKLVAKDLKLRQMRTAASMKRDVTVDVSAKAFRSTGLCCDIVQHAMLIPVLVGHLRFHRSLATLEKKLDYSFQNPYILQLAMTHPSYRENFGTNPDHARNALTNCGIRQPEYGDRNVHYNTTRKRGINTLINIMARFGAEDETESEISHNERLEFLGDAVVEFATSIHLYHLFPDLEEGGLATYRAAIVQNQHLAELAQNLQLDQFMLYAHGSDLCHDSELRHAMANCFEALMGSIFLDGGIEVADRIFGWTLFESDQELHGIWTNYPKHPLQMQEPKGDRHWIKSHGEVLKKLTEFEKIIGLEFTHIRLLARAFTDRSLGYNNLSRGSNQRLEFLGDTVLQLISSDYLYRHFPDHHEGHLSLLRSSLVNNRTQSLVCDDLGMTSYAMRGDPKLELKTKDRADLLEAFLGALYIDKGLNYCKVFCSVCFIPRLSTSILKQEWNDPKSKLQQCCLTLRTMDGNEPDIPQYKITESKGPTNTRVYVVAVFFRGERLATAEGHSIQEAEMNAAATALRESEDLFPQLSHQRRIIDKTNRRVH